MKTSKQILGFVTILIITYIAAAFGSIGMGNNIVEWYPSLNAPSFKPPNWVFGPVWFILYTFMAVAAFLIWRKGWNTLGVKVSIFLYGLQLFLNAMWSIIFFNWHLLGFAFFEIIILLFAIILTFLNFRRIDKWTGILFIPYILWVTFASILNGAFWYLN